MDPENPATEVEQLKPYARMCSILKHIYKNQVPRVDGSKSCCTLYLYNIQMQVVIKKSQDILFWIFKAFHFINLSCQEKDSEVWLCRVRKTS